MRTVRLRPAEGGGVSGWEHVAHTQPQQRPTWPSRLTTPLRNGQHGARTTCDKRGDTLHTCARGFGEGGGPGNT